MSRKAGHLAAGSLVVLAALVGVATAMRSASASDESHVTISEQAKSPILAPHLTLDPGHLWSGVSTQQSHATESIKQLTEADIRRRTCSPIEVVVVGEIRQGGAVKELHSLDPKHMPADVDGMMNGVGGR